MNRVIAYIDGFNLYFGLKDSRLKRYYWLNIQQLATNLLKADQTLVGVKYFTSRISANSSNEKRQRQNRFIEALETLPNTELFFGHYLQKEVKCRNCNFRWETHEEKMTDVNIAVKMLEDAHQDSFDTALLVSGDSDLHGPIESVRKFYPNKRVVIAFPPGRNSKKLQSICHAYFVIGRKKLEDSQFPDVVTKNDGFELKRPISWV